MNKRIHNKRFGKHVPHPWQWLVGLPPGTKLTRRSFYLEVDLSTPARRRAHFNRQTKWERKRVAAAIRRRKRRAARRLVVPGSRVRWVEVSGVRGTIGRIYLLPKGVVTELVAQFPEDGLAWREVGRLAAADDTWLKSIVAGIIS